MPNNKAMKPSTKQNKTQKKNAARRLKRKGAGGAGSTPASYNRTVRLRSPVKDSVIRGSEFVGRVSLPTVLTTNNAILFQQEVSPSLFVGSRMSLLARAYEKYRFKRLVLRYVPSVPTAIGGQIVAYFDLDVLDSFTGATSVDVIVRDAMAHQGAKLFNVNVPESVEMPIAPGLKDFFTGIGASSPQFYSQARIYVIGVAGLNGISIPASGAVGSLFVDYELHFEGEQMQELEDPNTLGTISSALVEVSRIGAPGGSVDFIAATTVLFAGEQYPGFTTSVADGVYLSTSNNTSTTSFTPFNSLNSGCPTKVITIVNKGVALTLKPSTTTVTSSAVMTTNEPWSAANIAASVLGGEIARTSTVDFLINNLGAPPVALQYRMMQSRLEKLEGMLSKFALKEEEDKDVEMYSEGTVEDCVDGDDEDDCDYEVRLETQG
jgi:hypothetical protein